MKRPPWWLWSRRRKLHLLVFVYLRRALWNQNQSGQTCTHQEVGKCQTLLFSFSFGIPSLSHNSIFLWLFCACPLSLSVEMERLREPCQQCHGRRKVTLGRGGLCIESIRAVQTLDCHWHLLGAHFQLIFKGLHLLKPDYDFPPTNWLICNWACVWQSGRSFITARLRSGGKEDPACLLT